jgi:hypothetical protein
VIFSGGKMNNNKGNIHYGEACQIIGEIALSFAMNGVESNKTMIAERLRDELKFMKHQKSNSKQTMLLAIQLLEEAKENESIF